MMLARGPFLGRMVLECERFNDRHPIGSWITIPAGALTNEAFRVRIIWPGAFVLGGHTPVVHVDGGYGRIALIHVQKDMPL